MPYSGAGYMGVWEAVDAKKKVKQKKRDQHNV